MGIFDRRLTFEEIEQRLEQLAARVTAILDADPLMLKPETTEQWSQVRAEIDDLVAHAKADHPDKWAEMEARRRKEPGQ